MVDVFITYGFWVRNHFVLIYLNRYSFFNPSYSLYLNNGVIFILDKPFNNLSKELSANKKFFDYFSLEHSTQPLPCFKLS